MSKKIAFVTGSSRGIGYGIAKLLNEEGWKRVGTAAAVFSGKIWVPEEKAQSNRKHPGPGHDRKRGGLSSCLTEGNSELLQKWSRAS